MALDFPNNPSPLDTHLDDNGRLWYFNNGYWQETIPYFSIDLLRDVETIFDYNTITFLDSTGFDSSISASEDFPFIMNDGTVSNIPFSPYGLPFYNSDGNYDEIDITLTYPPLNSILVWNGEIWVPQLVEYSLNSVIGIDVSDAVEDDILVWDSVKEEYVTDPKSNHIVYNPKSFAPKVAEISCEAGLQSTTNYTWYNLPFDTTNITSDVNMVDLANDRIICTSAGLYEVSFTTYGHCDGAEGSNTSNYLYSNCAIYNSSDVIKYKYYTQFDFSPSRQGQGGSLPSSYGVKHSINITDYIELETGDYMTFQVYRKQQFNGNYLIWMYGKMYMNKIGIL